MEFSARIYAELNEYLREDLRYKPSAFSFDSSATVGDALTSLGVPDSNVDLVLVNGVSVDCSYVLKDGDRVSVYPVFELFDISGLVRIRSRPLRDPRFVLDVHLGKLAYYMRMLGLDVLYRNDYRDEQLIQLSVTQRRTLLSKDRELLESDLVTRKYMVRSTHPNEQVQEVLERFDLYGCVKPLERCLRCNTILEPIEKESIVHRLPPMVAGAFNEFRHCPDCTRIYWKGSHYTRMESFINTIVHSRKEHARS
jgi:uncharacterized protein with PIN domain/sulfur carrier protein ThiS